MFILDFPVAEFQGIYPLLVCTLILLKAAWHLPRADLRCHKRFVSPWHSYESHDA